MNSFRRRRWLAIGPVLVVVVAGAWLSARSSPSSDAEVSAVVQRGEFKAVVTTAGELAAREFVQIIAPPNMQQAGAFQLRIASLVPEGTMVREGDLVAELDRSQLATRVADVMLALDKAQAQYEQASLDSTLTLSGARESIRNAELLLEERRLAREQAIYEAPTVRRQAEIDFERAERSLAQSIADYQTRQEQSQAKMREVAADVERQRVLLQRIQEVLAELTIRAPSPGMVIYVREWNGRKRTAGSQISSYDPVVATLPDLTKMESLTYVNEIDVRRVAVGQRVVVTLDADPGRRLAGTVASVANVGEQRPNTDAKVFEVKINIEAADTTLLPGMTTGNAIETLRVADALFIPLEAVHADNEITFVYRRQGSRIVRQEVRIGPVNEDVVVVLEGLEEDDRVLLSLPAGGDRLPLEALPSSAPPLHGADTAVHSPLESGTPPAGLPEEASSGTAPAASGSRDADTPEAGAER